MRLTDFVAVTGLFITAAAVTVALFQEDIKRWRLSPRIDCSAGVAPFYVKHSDSHYVLHAFVRIRVSVRQGRLGADEVQVLLLNCDPAAYLGGRFQIRQPEFLLPLRSSFDHLQSVDLPAGGARFIDLLEVAGNSAATATLTTTPAPPEGYLLRPSEKPYRVTFQVLGANFSPRTYVVEIVHNGRWNGTEAGLGSTVQVSRPTDRSR